MTPASTSKQRAGAGSEVAPALDVIALLASTIGPRRPCSPAEHEAAEALVRWLPTDTFENVSPATVERAVECGRAMLLAIDRLERR